MFFQLYYIAGCFGQFSFGGSYEIGNIFPNSSNCSCAELVSPRKYTYSFQGGWTNSVYGALAYDYKRLRIQGKLGFTNTRMNTRLTYLHKSYPFLADVKTQINSLGFDIGSAYSFVKKDDFTISLLFGYANFQHINGTKHDDLFTAYNPYSQEYESYDLIYRLNRGMNSHIYIGPQFRFNFDQSYFLVSFSIFHSSTNDHLNSTVEYVDEFPDIENIFIPLYNLYRGSKLSLSYFL